MQEKKKLRIAVWHNLPSGGGKRQLYYHIKGLIERGHYIEVWCPESADNDFLPLRNLVVEHRIPFDKKDFYYWAVKPSFFVYKLARSLEQNSKECAQQINTKNFDILFVNGCRFFRSSSIAQYVHIPSVLYLGEPYRILYEAQPELLWIKSKKPKFSKSRMYWFYWFRNCVIQNFFLNGMRAQARLEVDYVRKNNLILVNSLYSRECLLRTYNIESNVCYLGVDTLFYKPTGEKREKFIIGVGSLIWHKGLDRAIHAISKIEKEKRPLLIWVGNAASKTDLHYFIELASKNEVEFIPKINISDKEVVSLLSRATAMIYTPRLEPFGLAPLEANACGTPVVAIAEGGIRETMREGINGFLVAEDNPKILADKLKKFIENPNMTYQIGKLAREEVCKRWSFEKCIDNIETQLLSVYEKI